LKQIIDIVLPVVQILSLIALVIYVIKTSQVASATRLSAAAASATLDELKASRDQETAPYVVVFFEVSPRTQIVYIVVKNIGKSIANNVRMDFHPPLKSSQDQIQFDELEIIRTGISSMPPNYEVRTVFDSLISYFGKSELPLLYTVRVSYAGGIQSVERVSQQTLDLRALKGIMVTSEKGLDDVARSLEKFASRVFVRKLNETPKPVPSPKARISIWLATEISKEDLEGCS
jgi:hypothetical protein